MSTTIHLCRGCKLNLDVWSLQKHTGYHSRCLTCYGCGKNGLHDECVSADTGFHPQCLPCRGCRQGVLKDNGLYVSPITHYHTSCLPCYKCGESMIKDTPVDHETGFHPWCQPVEMISPTPIGSVPSPIAPVSPIMHQTFLNAFGFHSPSALQPPTYEQICGWVSSDPLATG